MEAGGHQLATWWNVLIGGYPLDKLRILPI